MAMTAALLPVGAQAAQAPLTTVPCGTVVTRSIRVANDLTNCSGVGLEIRAHGVTLDLNGHTIDGASNQSTGVLVDGFDRAVVKSGRLRALRLAEGVPGPAGRRVAHVHGAGEQQQR